VVCATTCKAAAARDRNKTLTALARVDPITGAQHREVQRP
jgi:hypothetical protein